MDGVFASTDIDQSVLDIQNILIYNEDRYIMLRMLDWRIYGLPALSKLDKGKDKQNKKTDKGQHHDDQHALLGMILA